MAILLNELLFFTALLFQMQSPVLAEEALLELNFKKQSFKMEFVHLQYPEKAEAQAQEFVARLESKAPFHHEELGLKIEKIKLKKIRGRPCCVFRAILRIKSGCCRPSTSKLMKINIFCTGHYPKSGS